MALEYKLKNRWDSLDKNHGRMERREAFLEDKLRMQCEKHPGDKSKASSLRGRKKE